MTTSPGAGSAYDAVVLAGGEGRRLGSVSKGNLAVAGRPLLDRALEAVAGAARRVVVGPAELARPAVPTTLEDPPLGGPVAGIDAGLRLLGTGAPVVVVLACDVPRAGEVLPAVLDALAGVAGADGAVAVDDEGHRQPLLGAYRRVALDAALAGLRADGGTHGRSVRSLVAGLALVEVPAGAAAADVDTWADVAAFEADERSDG